MGSAKGLGTKWLIVCEDLVKQPQQKWNDITNEDGVTEGYLCNTCDAIGPDHVSVTKLTPLAVESAEQLRKQRQ